MLGWWRAHKSKKRAAACASLQLPKEQETWGSLLFDTNCPSSIHLPNMEGHLSTGLRSSALHAPEDVPNLPKRILPSWVVLRSPLSPAHASLRKTRQPATQATPSLAVTLDGRRGCSCRDINENTSEGPVQSIGSSCPFELVTFSWWLPSSGSPSCSWHLMVWYRRRIAWCGILSWSLPALRLAPGC